MPGSQLLKIIIIIIIILFLSVPPNPQINNETGASLQQGVRSNTKFSGKIHSDAAGEPHWAGGWDKHIIARCSVHLNPFCSC